MLPENTLKYSRAQQQQASEREGETVKERREGRRGVGGEEGEINSGERRKEGILAGVVPWLER